MGGQKNGENMRTLKFRLVDKGRIISTQELKPGGIIDCPVDWDTAYQFTGLHDKYGKEIYEGDIIQNNISPGKSVVEFSEGRFILAHADGETCDELFYFHRDAYSTIEVIGKSYEKKED